MGMLIAGVIPPSVLTGAKTLVRLQIIHITTLIATVLLVVACGETNTTTPDSGPANAFTVDGDLLDNSPITMSVDFVPVSFNEAAKTNEFTMNGRAVSGDSVMLFLRFPGTTPGSYAWESNKSSPVYARLSIRRVSGQRVDLFPLFDSPSGTTVVTEYHDSIIRGTFNGTLRGSGFTVNVRDGIFRARR